MRQLTFVILASATLATLACNKRGSSKLRAEDSAASLTVADSEPKAPCQKSAEQAALALSTLGGVSEGTVVLRSKKTGEKISNIASVYIYDIETGRKESDGKPAGCHRYKIIFTQPGLALLCNFAAAELVENPDNSCADGEVIRF